MAVAPDELAFTCNSKSIGETARQLTSLLLKITGFLPFTPENRKVAVMEQGVECSGVTTLRVNRQPPSHPLHPLHPLHQSHHSHQVPPTPTQPRALSPRMFFAFALWFMAFLPACLHASFPSCHYYAIVPAF
uniref:HDC15728 n=1 Tax=Drosophila melanogaster TaxID=7227 RepID=Q6IJ79_DROME|nr:TPA_inf: HDC15728 [Drosophila melanogaster]